jgi:hypothetical protein
VEESGAEIPGEDQVASMKADLESILARVDSYYEESARIHEDKENGILCTGEFRLTYDHFFPKLTDPVRTLLTNLDDPAANLDDILLNAYRRRVT